MEPLATRGDVRCRRAVGADLAAIVTLLREDPLGVTRESADPAEYGAACAAIDADEGQLLLVLDRAGEVVGTVQLTSNATRTDALRFYQRLGFVATHLGLKLPL